jgi:hypothetical protein
MNVTVGTTTFLCASATTTLGVSLMIIRAHFPCRTKVDVFSFLMAKVGVIITIIKILQYAPMVIDETICYGVSVTASVLHSIHTAFVLLVINAALREPDQFVQLMVPSIAVVIPMGVLFNQSLYVDGQCLDKPFGTSLSMIIYVLYALFYAEWRIWKTTATFAVSVLGILAYGSVLKYQSDVLVHLMYMPCVILQMCIGMYISILFGSAGPAPLVIDQRSVATSISVSEGSSDGPSIV